MKTARAKLLQIGYPIYHRIAEMNHTFEETIEHLEYFAQLTLFSQKFLRACQVKVEEIRALANQEFAEVLSDREMKNSFHYERLRLQTEQQYQGMAKNKPRVRRKARKQDAT